MMKFKFIFCLLFFAQNLFALGFSDTLLNTIGMGTKAEDVCKKLVKVDQQDCLDSIKGKSFRSEFVSVCAEFQKKNKSHENLHKLVIKCLGIIADKSTLSASKDQAEVCSELVNSNNIDYVLDCLTANVITVFSIYCGNYLKKEKNYKSASACIQIVSDENSSTVNMKHFTACKIDPAIKSNIDSLDCLINAQNNSMNAGDSISKKIEAVKQKQAQQ